MNSKNPAPLTPQQELFCKWYTTKGDTFSNKTLSYAMAYDYDLPRDENDKIIVSSKPYNTCASNGSRVYFDDKVQSKIRTLLLEMLNDATVDARLNEILIGGQEANSIQAIKIHNDLKQRITKKIDITSAGRPLQALSDDELKALAE